MHAEKKIEGLLCFAREPGGAEVISAFLRDISPRSYFLFAKDYACDIFAENGLGFSRYAGETVQDLCSFLSVLQANHSVSIVITSAASMPEQDMTEKYLWKWARASGIPSIAILDQWQNYCQRFSGPDNTHMLEYLPDRICVMDQYAADKMMDEGIHRDKIVISGHPVLSDFQKEKHVYDFLEINRIKGMLKINPKKRLILFVSEPFVTFPIEDMGFNEVDILREVLLFLDHRLSKKNTPDNIGIIVKLHPKNVISDFASIKREFSIMERKGAIIWVQNEFSKIDLLSVADMVVGMTSILLMEAIALGVPTISLQIGAKRTDLCEAVNRKLIPLITDKKSMGVILSRLLDEPGYREKYIRSISEYKTSANPSEYIRKVASSLIKQKEI